MFLFSLTKKTADINFHNVSTGFPMEIMSQHRTQKNTDEVTHYPDLGVTSDWSYYKGNLLHPIRSTTQSWVVTHHYYGISVFISPTSFGIMMATSGGIPKCWLFSQAIKWVQLHFLLLFADSCLLDILRFDGYHKHPNVLACHAHYCEWQSGSIVEHVFWFISWPCCNNVCCQHERIICGI